MVYRTQVEPRSALITFVFITMFLCHTYSTKYLGVHLDKKLSFKTHIEEIKNKLKKQFIVSTNTKIDSEGIL